MADNVSQMPQRLVQDVIAPDVCDLKTRMSFLEKLVDNRFSSLEKVTELQFQAILSRVMESKLQSEVNSLRAISALTERVIALEARLLKQ